MKIAVVVLSLTGGGAERVAALWINGFYMQGHQVYPILCDKYSPQTYSIHKDIKIYNIDSRKGNNKYLNWIRRKLFQVRKLKEIFDKTTPDVVIVVQPHLGEIVYKAKGHHKFKIIGTDHNCYERPSEAPLTNRQIYYKYEFNKKFDQVTVLTQADKEYIGNRLTNVTVLPNPLAFTPVNRVSNKENIILAVGRYDVWHCKGFDILIKAWGKIASKYPNWKLLIMGQGKEENVLFLKKIISENNLNSQAELIPYQSPLPIYKKSAIFCLSSRYEGFGMVLIEAMSQGCACIACDYKGRQKEIITNDREGLICECNNVFALANSMDKMISDKEYRELVQKNAPQRAADYNINNIMEYWDNIFKKIGLQ